MMTQQYVKGNGHDCWLELQPSRRVRTRLVQRAFLAAQAVIAGQVTATYAASLFDVSVRSIRRGQLLIRDGNPQLVTGTLEGRWSLTDAEIIVLTAQAVNRTFEREGGAAS